MKTFVIKQPKYTQIIDRPEPVLAEDEVLLQIRRAGICGTDLSTYLGRNPLVSYPRVPGHEIGAVIVDTGGAVPDTISPGSYATVIPYTNCGTCTSCLRSRPNACRDNRTYGVQRDGAFVEYLSVPWQKLVFADSLSLEQLILVEPFSIGFHAVERGVITDSDTVMVIGCGVVGLGALIRAVLRGARVLAVDIDDAKLSIASILGARYTINSREVDLHAAVEDITGGNGADVVIEAVGNPATYRIAVEETAFAGRIVCIGYAGEDSVLPTHLFVKKEMDIRGSRNASMMDFQRVVDYLQSQAVPLGRLVTQTYRMEDAEKAFRMWMEHPESVAKIMITVGEP